MQDIKMSKIKLPRNWECKKFVDICLPKEGLKRGPFGSAIKKEFFVPDGNKVYEQSNAIYDDAFRGKYFIDDEKYNELINFNVIPGDIIVSCSGTLGRISVIPKNAKKGVINQALLRIRLIESIVSQKYFVYYFRSAEFQRKILVQSQGTAMTNMVGMKDFKEIEIILPPLETQQAIVSKIEELFSELDEGIENLKTAQQQLKTYRQSVLKWAFEGKFTNENVKDGELPEGWGIMKFGEVVNNYDGKRRPLSRDVRAKRQGKYRYYGATEIVDYIDDFLFDGKYLLIGEDGANLVSKSRPLAFIVEGKFWVNNHAHIIQTKELLNIDFLSYYFNSLNLAEYVTGTAQPKLNQANMNKIPIPKPKIEEQNKIVQELESRLSVADKMEESFAQSLQQAEALRQSILKKAFSGELI
jgi:type I restriction enzyme S subunit